MPPCSEFLAGVCWAHCTVGVAAATSVTANSIPFVVDCRDSAAMESAAPAATARRSRNAVVKTACRCSRCRCVAAAAVVGGGDVTSSWWTCQCRWYYCMCGEGASRGRVRPLRFATPPPPPVYRVERCGVASLELSCWQPPRYSKRPLTVHKIV